MSALNMEEFPRGQISTSPQNSEKELKISKNGTHCEMKKSGKQNSLCLYLMSSFICH